MSLRLSICVVLYRSAELSRRFAQELAASLAGFAEVEILFHDNSPDDELSDLAAYGDYTHDPRNLGFSYANNRLILAARYDNILLCNPDVFGFSPGFWTGLRAHFGERAARFVKLLNPDGTHQDCVGECSSLGRALRRPRAYADVGEPIEVGMGIMAFMLTTRAVFAEVGLLDADYPLFGEDMDWCHRAAGHGVPLVYDPRHSLVHTGGASSADRWSARHALRRKYAAERIFIGKHYRGATWAAMRGLNVVKRLVRARG